jgi:hypothetical protein
MVHIYNPSTPGSRPVWLHGMFQDQTLSQRREREREKITNQERRKEENIHT